MCKKHRYYGDKQALKSCWVGSCVNTVMRSKIHSKIVKDTQGTQLRMWLIMLLIFVDHLGSFNVEDLTLIQLNCTFKLVEQSLEEEWSKGNNMAKYELWWKSIPPKKGKFIFNFNTTKKMQWLIESCPVEAPWSNGNQFM